MAIFHLNHTTIGRSTHAPGTARGHGRYVLRESACSKIVGHVPDGVLLERQSLLTWLSECEQRDRINARVIDKITVALPIELDSDERVELVRQFAKDLCQSRIPWVAAFHDRDEDQQNPHVHMILRDRDFQTGKRVLNTSARGSTEQLRQAWELTVNEALERRGISARVSRLSNEARGIEVAATVHLGPSAEHLEERGVKTRRGEMNRKIRRTNQAFEEALAIVKAAEKAAREVQPTSTIGNEDSSEHETPAWLRSREDILSSEYGVALYGSDLARYWKISKTATGLEFTNARGGFVDLGDTLFSHNGNDDEIAAMLAVAKLKGWKTLKITGTPEFCERATAEARRAGFAIAHDVRDGERAEALADEVRERIRQRGRGRSR